MWAITASLLQLGRDAFALMTLGMITLSLNRWSSLMWCVTSATRQTVPEKGRIAPKNRNTTLHLWDMGAQLHSLFLQKVYYFSLSSEFLRLVFSELRTFYLLFFFFNFCLKFCFNISFTPLIINLQVAQKLKKMEMYINCLHVDNYLSYRKNPKHQQQT